MTDLVKKALITEVMDTFTRGPTIFSLFTDLGPVVRGGDSVEMPLRTTRNTVNTSETANPQVGNPFTPESLTVNRPKFINKEVTQQQVDQILGGGGLGGKYLKNIVSGMNTDMNDDCEDDLFTYLATSGYGSSASYNENLAADDVTDSDINRLVARMRDQKGIANTGQGLFWLTSPGSEASIKSVAAYVETPGSQQGVLGLPQIARLAGLPVYMHNGIYGTSNYRAVATTAVSVTSNVATATVASGHGFVAGQKIWTSGLTANVAQGSAVAITSVTSTTIVYPQNAGDGAMADGVGEIRTGSCMALLCYAPWIFYAFDGVVPRPDFVKRSDAAGWAAQLYAHMGRSLHAGGVMALHAPLVI